MQNSKSLSTAWYHAGFWILFFALIVFMASSTLPFETAVLRASFTVSILVAVFYGNITLVNMLWTKERKSLYLFAAGILLITVSWLRMMFEKLALNDSLVKEFDTTGINVGLFFFASTFLVILLSFFYQNNRIRETNQKRLIEIINRQNKSQLEYLKAQINPHFLFNTLNNIYAMTTVDPPHAGNMILKLSGLLRYAVYQSSQSKVDLEEEVTQITNFIGLFNMKSEQKPDIKFETDIASKDISIEPMLLIPLVENCLKHSDFDDNPDAYVSIKLQADEDRLQMQTENSKNGNAGTKEHGGVGLDNLKKRLQLIYPGRHHFKVNEQSLSFKTELNIQWQPPATSTVS